jgi:hypothetical protein
METEFRLLRNDVPMSDEQVEEAVGRLSGVAGFSREQTGQSLPNLRRRLQALVKDPEKVRAARARLVESLKAEKLKNISLDIKVIAQAVLDASVAEKLVQAFPPGQVILLDEKRHYEIQRDEQIKLLALAPWQVDHLTDQNKTTRGAGLFADFLPHIASIRRAQARLEERIALLRHIEALRLYAADHGGALPVALSELSVPLPNDPVSGKAIEYKLDGTTAHLRGSPPGAGEKTGIRFCYEVVLRK